MIGIDLGTTNSLAAYWSDGKPVIIPNSLGEPLTPSVVSVDDDGRILVGQAAKERLITHPDRTASVFKRDMGTNRKYMLGPLTFTPEELSSFVLKSIREDAEEYLKMPVSEAIISVPAYFNDEQRKSTRDAAILAGIHVKRLVSEPTCAAIAYGMHLRGQKEQFIVLDLGGGTFDVSILEMYDGIMEVKAVAGNAYLGGEDFTQALVRLYLARIGLARETLTEKELAVLIRHAERAKMELSAKEIATMQPFPDQKYPEVKLTRDTFEEACSSLLLEIRAPIERAMRDADLRPNEITAVILVGGSTRLPMIRKSASQMFQKLPFVSINPDQAIALGAATYAALIERNVELEEIILTDVCPFTLGLEVTQVIDKRGNRTTYFMPIIERNTTLPYSHEESLVAIYDMQQAINIKIYQGESIKPENNQFLGSIRVAIPPAKAGVHSVNARFTYDISGLLEVEAYVPATNEKKRLVIESRKGTMSPEEIEARLQKLASIKMHPRDQAINRALLARADRVYEETLGEVRLELGQRIADFSCLLNTQKDSLIQEGRRDMEAFLNQLEKDNLTIF